MRTASLVFLSCLLVASPGAAGQDDILKNARAAATSGHREEALSMLETHLSDSPRDVDARLLYGLVLSWEGRYDEACPALQQVLTQTPGYTDARVALMNVEYWSGHSTEALEQADRILTSQPGNVTARAVHDRIEAANRPWWASTSYSLDTFDDGTEPWHEVSASVTRRTAVGSLIVRWNHANRFALQDNFIEAEFYPRFRPGTYAFIGAGVAPESVPFLYPQRRVAFDLYQSLGHGFEASGGARYLDFSSITQIYLGTLTKYVGNWMWTGKIYYVPGEGDVHSNTYVGGFRRYFGGDGTSYVGLGYSHGFSREEVRTFADLVTFDSDTVRGEFDVLLGSRTRLSGSAGVSHQERPNRSPVWHTTITAGLSVQF
jgi:YaiO family outer membrane protein